MDQFFSSYTPEVLEEASEYALPLEVVEYVEPAVVDEAVVFDFYEPSAPDERVELDPAQSSVVLLAHAGMVFDAGSSSGWLITITEDNRAAVDAYGLYWAEHAGSDPDLPPPWEVYDMRGWYF